MTRYPSFSPHLRVQVVPGEGVFFLSGMESSVLTGKIYELLAPLLDGRRSEDELADLLEGDAAPAEVYYALSRMRQKGFFSKTAAPAGGRASFWSMQGMEGESAERRLRERPVAVLSAGSVPPAMFAAHLQAALVPCDSSADFTVLLADDYLDAGVADAADRLSREGRGWMPVKPVGRDVWVGPLFLPGTSPCWNCFATLLRMNRSADAYLREKGGSILSTGIDSPSPPVAALALSMAALETVRILGGEDRSLLAKLLTFDILSRELRLHPVPGGRCPACRKAAGETSASPVSLVSRKKSFVSDGGHRTATPEETLEKYAGIVSPFTGIVRSLEPAGPDPRAPVYLAGQNFALRGENLRALRSHLRGRSAGKGKTPAQARASALCEAVERYSGIFQGHEHHTLASLRDLGESAIDPNACMLFSERQYREREEWNRGRSSFHIVPPPFDPEEKQQWSKVWSLTAAESRYLPTSYLYYHAGCRRGSSPPDSNGCAAGNTLEEAVLQGFLELVERDAVALWWYPGARRPGVDLDSFGDPYPADLAAYYHEIGRDIWALDITSDLGIPTFVALSRRREGEEEILFGFGSHLDARVALLRALTEMNQFLPRALNRGKGKPVDDEVESWLREATVNAHPYLAPDPRLSPKKGSDYPLLAGDDLLDDIALCRSRVEQRGMEMLVLDQTRPEAGLPVVKVIVPGLRHFWPRFAPGRLFDVPLTLGWIPAAQGEEDLNPIPMFL